MDSTSIHLGNPVGYGPPSSNNPFDNCPSPQMIISPWIVIPAPSCLWNPPPPPKQIWMCQGTLLIVTCSHVGHVFRKATPYTFPGGTGKIINHNNARLAEVWMDEWKEFYYKINPGTIPQPPHPPPPKKKKKNRKWKKRVMPAPNPSQFITQFFPLWWC